MDRTLQIGAALVLFGAGLAGAGTAQDADPQTGWWTQWGSEGPDGPHSGAIRSRAAFAIEAGEALHPGSDASSVVYQAELPVRWTGEYRFGLDAVGTEAALVVTDGDRQRVAGAVLNGDPSQTREVTDALPAERGATWRLQVRATPGDGAARLRVLWAHRAEDGSGFDLEPIPTSAVRPFAGEASSEEEEAAYRGRMLLETKGCTRCHAPGRAAGLVGERAAPVLDGAGERIGRDWMERWITSPDSMRGAADMPSLLGTRYLPDEAALAELVDYLSAAGDSADAEIASEASVLDEGRLLYHSIGCVACHGPLATPEEVWPEAYYEAEEEPPEPPVALEGLHGKWRLPALAEFLREPLAVYPDGRMPSMSLNEEEADLIAHYLLSELGVAAPAAATAGEAPRPAALDGCAACHTVADAAPAELGPDLLELDGSAGCLDPTDRSTPRYELTQSERADILAAIDWLVASRGARWGHDQLDRTMERLNCSACHSMDQSGGLHEGLKPYFVSLDERADLGDEGRFPPDLSGVGFKLTTTWLDQVLVERGRARPYLAARMPQYGADHVGELAELLARAEGIPPHYDVDEPLVSDADIRAGRELMGRETLACITCHDFGDYPTAGTPGPAITDFAERLRYEWYRVYMHNPGRYKRGTRMPSFGSANSSAVKTVLDGDLTRQFDAMWGYFALGESMPVPDGLDTGDGYRVGVGESPVVLRTFLESSGSRAIAVGMPIGLHYAFDAEEVRLVEAWSGEFLDAAGIWAGRGGSPVGGRGELVWSAPAGPALVLGKAPNAWPEATGPKGGFAFEGYRLDADGLPIFAYRLGELSVREKTVLSAAPAARIVRSFEIEPLPRQGLSVLLPAGASASARGPVAARTVELLGGASCYEITVREGTSVESGGSLQVVLEVEPQ